MRAANRHSARVALGIFAAVAAVLLAAVCARGARACTTCPEPDFYEVRLRDGGSEKRMQPLVCFDDLMTSYCENDQPIIYRLRDGGTR